MNGFVRRLGRSRAAVGVQLRTLTRVSARAFGAAAPKLRGLSPEDALEAYARLTCREAERAMGGGRDMDALGKALYEEAYALGSTLRRLLRPGSMDDCLDILILLYENIGITLAGNLPGELHISRCYFSGVYSGPVCRVISALDRGIFAGLCGGGKLEFTRRITEGAGACRAHFEQ